MEAVETRHFTVRNASWVPDGEAMRHVRSPVFVAEQHIPAVDEWDERDALCRHALAHTADGTAVGTGRPDADQKIGRLAVLPGWRCTGIGTALLRHLMTEARSMGLMRCHLQAQRHAVPFYIERGFEPEGAEFVKSRLPHRRMTARL